MQPRSIGSATPLAITAIAPSRSSGIFIVRAKLFAVPSGSKAKIVSVPTKWSMLSLSDPSPPPTMTIGARSMAAQIDLVHPVRIIDRMRFDQVDPGGDQLVMDVFERLGAPAAHGVDDKDGLAGKGVIDPTVPFVPSEVEGRSPRRISTSLDMNG